MKYKNLFFAYSFELLLGLILSAALYFTGPKASVLLALLALRPFILEKEHAAPGDSYWFSCHLIAKYSVVTVCAVIILLYLIAWAFSISLSRENAAMITVMLMPLFLLVHGVFGLLHESKIIR